MQGWIKLHRQLMTKSIWLKSSAEQKVILVALLMLANHSENEWEWDGKIYNCHPGQFVTSIKSIGTNCGSGITRQNIRTALKRFEKLGFLTIKTTKLNSLISICKWETYQKPEKASNQPTNHQLTISQPSPNHHLTTNKNVKNENNDKLYTLQDVQNAGCLVGFHDPECLAFFNHYNSQGWLKGNSLPITDLTSQLTNWRNNGYKFPDKPKPAQSTSDVLLKQWNDRFGDFVKNNPANVVVANRTIQANLKDPNFKQWAIGINAAIKEAV